MVDDTNDESCKDNEASEDGNDEVFVNVALVVDNDVVESVVGSFNVTNTVVVVGGQRAWSGLEDASKN